MMELLGAVERRVMNKWARKGDRLMAAERVAEDVACGIAETSPFPAPAAGRRGVEGRPDPKVRRPALSQLEGFWFGTGLAPKRIFHIAGAT
jgi:hypothetical protein